MENNITLDLKRRREIYEYIAQNSGLHMRDLSRKMNIPFTSLKYHLSYLEKKGLILSREDGKYNRYFVSLEIGEQEKRILNFFRKRTALYILLWFFIAAQCSQKDLSRFLEKNPATIGFYLRNMIRAGIIEQVRIDEGVIHKETLPNTIKRPQVSSEKIYVLKDPWMTYELLMKHKDHLEDKTIVEGIIEVVEFHISNGIPKQILNRDDAFNSILNTSYGYYFPPSFCS
jgi:DNA-binding transcriptional ArsR family regulator